MSKPNVNSAIVLILPAIYLRYLVLILNKILYMNTLRKKILHSAYVAIGVLGLAISLFSNSAYAQDGQKLFEANCAGCHHPVFNSTGPALQGVKAKWEAEAESPELIYTWVNNFENAVAESDYAKAVAASRPSAMNKFNLTNEQIDAIFTYVDGFTPPTAEAGNAGGVVALEEEEGLSWWWYITGALLLVVVWAAASNSRQLKLAAARDRGEEVSELERQSYADIFRSWALRNVKVVAVIGLVFLFAILAVSANWMKGIGVYEGYHPEQPAVPAFSHNIHVEINGIDCKYCHNSVTESKHAGIPTVNVCMNCHKGIPVDNMSDEGKKSMAKVWGAAGYDGIAYTGKTHPLVWNRVYVLPDHVYFNHSQHVTVGGLECANCHGEVEKMTTARLIPVKEALPVGEIAENQLTKPTLTMGWCIECHRKTTVMTITTGDKTTEGAYYEEIHRRLKKRPEFLRKYKEDENKISVAELGGLECAKCHY